MVGKPLCNLTSVALCAITLLIVGQFTIGRVQYGKFSKFLQSVNLLEREDVVLNSNATNATNATKTSATTGVGLINNVLIPRIVHQEWKGKELPPNFRVWRDECIRLNPEWEFKLWTDEDNLKLVRGDYPQLLNLYNNYDANIKRIDMVRYLYLHKFGGVYMDLDVACMKPFGSFFDEYPNKFIVVNQYKREREYANAIMASPPAHDIFESIFTELPIWKNYPTIEATGGLLLQYHVLPKSILKGKWVEMPFELFYAQDWMETKKGNCNSFDDCRTRYPNAITVTMWAGTWTGEGTSKDWQDSNNVSAVTKYNITEDIFNKIYVSGVFDKDFCLECIWKGNTPCHRRLDYVIRIYGESRETVIDNLVHKEGRCQATAIKPNENATNG